jgi:cell division transport system permease protein
VLSSKSDVKPNLERLRAELRERVPTATLDDHHVWIERLSTMANTVVAIGIALVALVLTATGLAVGFATRGAMAGNRDIIEVLHFVGADDAFIAREFQARFLRLGLKGGALGGLLAVLLIAVVGWLAGSLRTSPGGNQLEAMFGGFEIGWRGYVAVLAIAGIVAVVTAITSRFTVRRHLEKLY